jgi:propionyl-CoA carboxylase alpha chain
VKRLEKEGITWIGPDSKAMYAMGDKIESKKIAKKAGVNIIPGKLADIDTIEEVLQIGRNNFYSLFLKFTL